MGDMGMVDRLRWGVEVRLVFDHFYCVSRGRYLVVMYILVEHRRGKTPYSSAIPLSHKPTSP